MDITFFVGPAIATGLSALLAALYVVTGQVICRKLAITLLLIAVVMWTPVVLMATGVVPMPRNHAKWVRK